MALNMNPIKELLILIMGPIFQVLAYFLLINLFEKEIVLKYHLGILVFNLLPIYPLDGGKILNLLINIISPYKRSFKIGIIISYLINILVLFNNKRLSIDMILTYVMLLILIRREELKIPITYQKFILERYLNNYHFKRKITINNINNLYRHKENIISENGQKCPEKVYFEEKYNKFHKNC